MKKKLILIPILCVLCIMGIFYYNSMGVTKTEAVPKTDNTKHTATLTAVGDNLIHSTVYKVADRKEGKSGDGKYNFNSFYKYVKDDLKNSDIAFINQETVLGGGKPSTYPQFNTPDDMIKSLDYMGIDVANGATNHSLDKYQSGVKHQIELFKKFKKITLIGMHKNKKTKEEIIVTKKNGMSFAWLSYTYGTNGIPSRGYEINYFDKKLITRQVKKAKKMADFVIVSAHWGTEYNLNKTSYQKKYAKLFADLNVDLVIGTHPHVIGPMEWKKGKNGHKTLIAYSLGNFLSAQVFQNTSLEGMLSCRFVKQGNKKYIDNVKWTPLVNHFNTKFGNYHIYKLKDYTEKLAKTQYIYNKVKIKPTKAYYKKITHQVIKKFEIDD